MLRCHITRHIHTAYIPANTFASGFSKKNEHSAWSLFDQSETTPTQQRRAAENEAGKRDGSRLVGHGDRSLHAPAEAIGPAGVLGATAQVSAHAIS